MKPTMSSGLQIFTNGNPGSEGGGWNRNSFYLALDRKCVCCCRCIAQYYPTANISKNSFYCNLKGLSHEMNLALDYIIDRSRPE